jgi:lipopolysaccharide export system permease protein
MPSVLSLYIARRFFASLSLILLAVSLVIFFADYVEVLRRFSDEDAFTALLGVRLAAMHVPILLDQILPFAFLFAGVIGLLGLSRSLELVVARASGVSVWGFLRGPLVVSLLFGAVATTVLNPVAVSLNERAEQIQAALSNKIDTDHGSWFRQQGDGTASIVYAGSIGDRGRTLFGATAFVFGEDGNFLEKVTAPRVEFGPGAWTFLDATVASEGGYRREARYPLPTELTSAELRRRSLGETSVSIWSLPQFIETAKRSGLDTDRFQVSFHRLVSRPLFLLAMVMIAATVSLRLGRQGGLWRLILTGAAAGFLLYAFAEIVSDLGSNGIIAPMLAAWLPPLVALTLGATSLLIQEDG